jgi:hypothetical protein
MKKISARVLIPLAAASALFGLAGGVADAAPAPVAPTAQDTPIWVTPGLDLGAWLGPAIQDPTQLLAPVFYLITLTS